MMCDVCYIYLYFLCQLDGIPLPRMWSDDPFPQYKTQILDLFFGYGAFVRTNGQACL